MKKRILIIIIVALIFTIAGTIFFIVGYKERYLPLSEIATSSEDCLNKGSICSSGTPLSVKVSKKETRDFYILEDDGNTVLMIMKDNLTNSVKWSDTGNIKDGPENIISEIRKLTRSWNNIVSRPYVYSDSNNNYKQDKLYAKGRIPSLEDLEKQDCQYAISSSCKDYITSGLENEVGYWLMDTKDLFHAMIVTSHNGIGICDIKLKKCYKNYGIRLIVEIDK